MGFAVSDGGTAAGYESCLESDAFLWREGQGRAISCHQTMGIGVRVGHTIQGGPGRSRSSFVFQEVEGRGYSPASARNIHTTRRVEDAVVLRLGLVHDGCGAGLYPGEPTHRRAGRGLAKARCDIQGALPRLRQIMSGEPVALIVSQPRMRRWHVPARFVPLLLALPTLLLVFLVIGVPLVYSLVMSLNEQNVLTHRWIFVGLQNYVQAFTDPAFPLAFLRTAIFAAGTVLAGLVVGMGMALVMNARFSGRGTLRGLVLIPWAMSPVAVGILWNWIFNGDYGPLNAILLDLGLTQTSVHWLGDGSAAFALVGVV